MPPSAAVHVDEHGRDGRAALGVALPLGDVYADLGVGLSGP
jgi:hypothetical protein